MRTIEFTAYAVNPERLSNKLIALGGKVEQAAEPGSGIISHSTAYSADGWRATIDVVAGAYFIKIAVTDNGADSKELAHRLRNNLDIREFDLSPWSYETLHAMLTRAREHQEELNSALHRLILIDGPSGAGKSSVVSALRNDFPSAKYVRRRTTRPPRGEANELDEYVFVDPFRFKKDVEAGEYLESKDFLFNMSYGIHWEDVKTTLTSGDNPVGFGVINLGTIAHVRNTAPQATTILLTADVDTIRRRLETRGMHSPEALQERLENAERAVQVADRYTHVIENPDGSFAKVVSEVSRIMLGVATGN